jgi:uncharacterized membrane protein YtjA (UPF0391 family)
MQVFPDDIAIAENTALSSWLPNCTHIRREEIAMLYYALVFLVIALVAGLLGFGVVAFAAAGIAKILFFVFLVLFLISLVSHFGRSRAL